MFAVLGPDPTRRGHPVRLVKSCAYRSTAMRAARAAAEAVPGRTVGILLIPPRGEAPSWAAFVRKVGGPKRGHRVFDWQA